MINVSKLKRGIVIDHIVAGQGYRLFKQLKLDELQNEVVVLMRNVDSEKMGKKDLIKIETDLDLDLPESVTGILTCKNPRCISNIEKVGEVTFYLVDSEKKEYACEYCDSRTGL
jgi:aspartate carbamoyltransferase regulatory subunit